MTPAPAGFTADWLGQRVVFADGALGQLTAEVAALGAERVLLIAGRSGEASDRAAELLAGRLAARFGNVRQHVPGDLAAAVVYQARRAQADAIVSIGGGSATGLAKICALETMLPVLAIPTTYAGSEMTPVWGRTDGAVKRTGRDTRVLPRTVIYDPLLVAGMPPALAGPSGMNALAHCVEALYVPGADPLTSMAAMQAARLIATWLPAACSAPDAGSDQARSLLWASCLAGRAFGTVGGSLHHSLCHLLGGFAALPHAATHAVVLPQVVAFLAPSLGPRLGQLAEALGASPADVAGAIWDLGAQCGTPAGLRALGLSEASLPAIADTLYDRSPASPRPVSRADALAVVTAAWHGARPSPAATSPAKLGPSPSRSATAAAGEPVTAADLTEAVLARLLATPDPRLRHIMTSLIRRLHGFVADVQLTQDEWLAAIRFLTTTGQISGDRRQEFILLSDTLGVSMLVDLLAGPSGRGAAGTATESTVLGPFYVADSPERDYGASIAERPSGDPAWVTGRVTDVDGNPIAGATLDVWQNADDMLYAVQNPDSPPDNLRGLFRAGQDGSYAFLGVRPTDYPIPADGPVGRLLTSTGRHPWRPAHIHLIVSAPGYQSVATHIFDSASKYLDSDAVFAAKASLVRDFERHEPSADGVTAPDGTAVPEGVPPGQAWYSLRHDFLLVPVDHTVASPAADRADIPAATPPGAP
ncbi:MAG TPA: iron-containing alcohol dehydrogenase [Streptosporangiaceae bacterium]|nr:iron-containing alcohol dehydrogenase [Streptosporangiaceae bacterium]